MSLLSLEDQLPLNPHTSPTTQDVVQTRYKHETKYSNLKLLHCHKDATTMKNFIVFITCNTQRVDLLLSDLCVNNYLSH